MCPNCDTPLHTDDDTGIDGWTTTTSYCDTCDYQDTHKSHALLGNNPAPWLIPPRHR